MQSRILTFDRFIELIQNAIRILVNDEHNLRDRVGLAITEINVLKIELTAFKKADLIPDNIVNKFNRLYATIEQMQNEFPSIEDEKPKVIANMILEIYYDCLTER